MLASLRECEQGEKIMVSEEATPARYNRVLPQFTVAVKRSAEIAWVLSFGARHFVFIVTSKYMKYLHLLV
jgi:hypothetical protein